MSNFFQSSSSLFSNHEESWNCFLDVKLVDVVELHQKNVNDVYDHQNDSFPQCNAVSKQECWKDTQIDHDEESISTDDPPVNLRSSIS